MTEMTADTKRGPILSTATNSLTQPSGPCSLCDGTGWRVISVEPDRRVARCACQAVSNDGRVRSVLPPLLQAARLSHFAEPLLGAAQRWLEQPSHGLFLTGPAGTGKTWLGAAIVRALIERGKMVRFKAAADFYLAIRSSFTNPNVDEFTILSQAGEPEVFLFDDLGAGSTSDFERRAALHVLDTRLSHLRPTIVTSNLSVEQIGQVMDERIASRVGAFTRIAMTGRDLRGKS
jgi:hypothetical protein